MRFGSATESDGIPPPSSALDKGIYIEANNVNLNDNASYVRFVHASLGYPAPTTFLHAVMAGYITAETQYPRLTGKMVRKHMPNALATAKGHLDRKPSATPHANSDAVSALRRHDTRSQHDQQRRVGRHKKPTVPFSPMDVPKSKTVHLDYTGPLPEVCTTGTRYFQIACWGGYIHLQPLVSLRAEHTTQALRATVEFFRKHDVEIGKVRMDNQQSQPLLHLATELKVAWDLVPPYINHLTSRIQTVRNEQSARRRITSSRHEQDFTPIARICI